MGFRKAETMHHLTFPNENADYREARAALLDAEISLRRQIEAVAAQRRALPPGGAVPEDYAFERIGAYQRPETVRLSELFGDKSSIILQSFRSEGRRVGKESFSTCRYRWSQYP